MAMYPITLGFSNGSTTTEISGETNFQQERTLGAQFLGTTTLTVTTDSQLYIPPAPITLNFKNGVTFAYSPQIISPGIPFNVYLQKSIPISNAYYSTVSVYLTCGGIQIQTWTRVKMNQLSTLSGIPSDIPSQSNCLLTTTSDGCYYPASTSISIVPSPSAGQLYPITPAQQVQFAVDIAFPPGITIAS